MACFFFCTFMPEGPSIVILKNLCKPFKGMKIISVDGNTKIGKERLKGKKIIDFKSWGKHFLICFKDFTVRIHFLMFGSYRINEERELAPRLALNFKKGQLNFYSCSVKFIEGDLNEVYDWTGDVMSRRWNPASAIKKIKASSSPVCDLLLDQNIFAGVGNIIKNEVLYRIKVHPLTIARNLPQKKLKELVAEARTYSFDFLKWKKKYVLRKHWLAHTKKTCVRCNIPLTKEYLGKTNRRTFYCSNCQVLY
jgi:endonuclease-8